jgi:hypothetical protein
VQAACGGVQQLRLPHLAPPSLHQHERVQVARWLAAAARWAGCAARRRVLVPLCLLAAWGCCQTFGTISSSAHLMGHLIGPLLPSAQDLANSGGLGGSCFFGRSGSRCGRAWLSVWLAVCLLWISRQAVDCLQRLLRFVPTRALILLLAPLAAGLLLLPHGVGVWRRLNAVLPNPGTVQPSLVAQGHLERSTQSKLPSHQPSNPHGGTVVP